ncbi:complement decay-accelerating factor isoform X2 [Xiphias gladius]|uniref:complement decay-accelerating factor isoform X2 n=1 Tax=Xiphias gladius TaxID=8245 RepID=UPI001A997786|nr:complement decay-accelerating factor isoform X2 [Xiphias gladius]
MDVSPDTCGRRRYLPLLCLLVLEAAANCPGPQGTGNIVLTSEALLLNHFPEDSQVTVECANGYIEESGSGVIKCIGGKWTEPDLICKKKDCGHPKLQPRMIFNIEAGTLFGAVVTVACEKGYQIIGSRFKQCYATGWVGRANCELVTCERPDEVANGRSLWDSEDDPIYGDVIKFACNVGYSLIGKESIICSETGEFDFQPPECKRVTTEEKTTAKKIATTHRPPAQVSTSAAGAATSTAHRNEITSATSALPSPAKGGRDILTPEDKANTTRATQVTSFQDQNDGTVTPSTDTEYMPVILSVTCVLLAACIAVFVLYRFNLRRKGSYDTQEDLKPELLQFQNV